MKTSLKAAVAYSKACNYRFRRYRLKAYNYPFTAAAWPDVSNIKLPFIVRNVFA